LIKKLITNSKNILERFLYKYNNIAFKKPKFIVLASFTIALISIIYAVNMPVKTDFFELLPENYRSIDDLQTVLDKVGGIGNLIVAVETNDFEAGKLYVEKLAKEIRKLPKDMVTDVNYEIKNIESFFENNALFYLSKDDLNEVKNRLKTKFDYEKKKNNPLYFFKELLTPVEFNLDDIEAKYKNKTNSKAEDAFKDGYISGHKGSVLAIMIKPKGSSAGVEKSRELINEVENIINKTNKTNFGKNIKIEVHLAGNIKSMAEEYDIIMGDVTNTLLLVFGLVGLVIFLFLGTLSSIFLLLLSLTISASWTMAITYAYIGQLNSQTAFLTALVIGTGVNYGIIYLSRYYEERKNGLNIFDALSVASRTTLIQTLLASTTTAVAFVTLMFAHTRGFSQFGFIGSVGVILCWINTFLLLPSLIIVWEKTAKIKKIKRLFSFEISSMKKLSPLVCKHYLFTYAIFVVLLGFSAYYFVGYYEDRLESDFSKLRNVESTKGGSAYWDQKVGDIVGENISITPSVIIADNIEEAEEICKSIDKKLEEMPEKFKNLASCYSVQRLLPTKQKDKLPIIKEIKELLHSGSIKFLEDDLYDDVIKFRSKIKTNFITLKDLPYQMTKHFDDVMGNKGVVVIVNPLMEQKLTENLTTFAELVRINTLPNGKTIYSSGEAVIYADLLNAISVDGPLVTILSLILVIIFVMIAVRKASDTAVIIGALLSGVILTFGFVAFFNIKLNFFNFIALPLMFGTCVDYGSNIYMRYKEERNIELSLNNVGNAVLLCSLTTIVSYITLMTAKNQALVSFAKIALIGEITSLFGAFFILPAIIMTIQRVKSKKDRQEEL
jgi:uncharacterized protein